VEGLAEWFNLDLYEMEFVKDNLIFNDFVSIKDFLSQKDGKKVDIFLKLMEPAEDIKPFEKIISDIKIKKVLDSFNYLKKIYQTLDELGFSEHLIIDFSIIRQFSYYSGLIFEVYCPKITELIGSGGRYDGLIKEFGLDVPATGFALDIDLLHKSLDKPALKTFKNMERAILFGLSKECSNLIKFAEGLKNKGLIVELFFDDDSNLKNLASAKKAGYIYRPDFKKSTVEIIDLIKKTTRTVKIDECS
jgi:ATP phosphoribosyltransferase regulatory subunit